MTDGARNTCFTNRPEEAARRLLDSISESLSFEPDKLVPVAGQFITPNGSQVRG